MLATNKILHFVFSFLKYANDKMGIGETITKVNISIKSSHDNQKLSLYSFCTFILCHNLSIHSFLIILYIYRVPTGLEDVSKYVDLFSALYASGKWSVQVFAKTYHHIFYTLVSDNFNSFFYCLNVQELKQLAGLNFLRVWREVENVSGNIICLFIYS